MFLFRRRAATDIKKEAEIQAIRQDTFKKVDKANKSMDKLTDLLDNKSGVTELIFYATGGAKRDKRTK